MDLKKHDPPIHCLKKTHFRSKDTVFESKRVERISHANRNQKGAAVAIQTSDKRDFKLKTVTRNKGIIY